MALCLRLGECAGVNGVDDGACVREADACADTVSSARPTGVDKPHASVVLLDLLRQQFRVLVRMPHQERTTEAWRKRRLRLGDAHFRACDLRGIPTDKVVHRM